MTLRIISICFVLLAIAATVITIQERKISSLSRERKQAIAFARRDSSRAAEYFNQYGHQVRRVQETELSLRNAQELAGTEHLAFLKELEGVKSNLKNLTSAISLQARATAELRLHLHDSTIVISPGDSIHVHKFGYVDKFNSIKGYIEGDTTALVRAAIIVPIDGAVYWERSRILGLRIGAKKFYSEFSSPNPWVRLDYSDYIKIEKR